MAERFLRDAGHAARADRLDARLLDRLEHRARLLAAGHELAMHRRIVAGEPQRHRIGMAAHDRGIRRRRACAAARAGAPCRRSEPGRSAAKVTSSSGLRAIARRQPATARLNGSVGRFLAGSCLACGSRHGTIAGCRAPQLSATLTELSGNSCAEAALIELGDERPLQLVAFVEEGDAGRRSRYP